MKRGIAWAAAVLVVAPLLAGCGKGENSFIPPGTYAGSLGDGEFILDVGEEVHVNKLKARFVKSGVIEIDDHSFKATLTCKVTDKKKAEELRCVFDFPGNAKLKLKPVNEVIDLMLL